MRISSVIYGIVQRWNFRCSRRSRAGKSANSVWRISAVLAMAALPGCSIHPLVDDLSPFPTEAIVAAARCELRLGLVEMVEVWFQDEEPTPVRGFNPNTIAEHLTEMKRRFPNVDLTNDWSEWMDISIAYDWTFDITETDHADSALDFKLPFLPTDTFTDELTFTTTVDGKLGGGVTLSPVPKQFKLASASVNLEGTRVDLNKVKISIAFPKARQTQKPTNNWLQTVPSNRTSKAAIYLMPIGVQPMHFASLTLEAGRMTLGSFAWILPRLPASTRPMRSSQEEMARTPRC